MPQINRVRIINFSYNNNNRNIVDETFDFFQGENALLSLKNGGGKSVLVQLLLQPIIPKTRLMSRRIEDFFRGKKSPTYVLVEWKLEDQGGYLLTGIGLTNKESQVREQDESNNSTKYFTFTSNYRQSNVFDIENIPLIKRVNEKIYVETFKDAKKLISAKEKDPEFAVELFTDEDKDDYRVHLESFNIFQDEWKSIILKINESEGGVIEIFEKCKTSQQLMNDWILKSIEKVVNKEDRDQKKLEQMLENLVEEMISNEQFIYEKELYQEFLRESDKFLDQLNELTNSIDKENEVEKSIASMYFFLKYEINKMKEEIQHQEEIIENSGHELNQIDLEERSKAYYDELATENRLTESLNDEKIKLDSLREKLGGIKYQVLVQEAAREYGNIKRIKVRIEGINEQINKIKFSGDQNEKIKNLEYSLKLAYEKLLTGLKEKESILVQKLDQINGLFKDYDVQIDEIDKQNSKLQGEKGSVESKIESFEDYENKVRLQLGLNYERNLIGEIEQGYFDECFSLIKEEQFRLNEEKTVNDAETQRLEEQIKQTKEKINLLREQEKQQTIDDTKLEQKIDNYNDLETSLKPLFERHNLNFNNRFHHQKNELFIKNRINLLQRTEMDLALNIQVTKEKIDSLNNGTLHVSKEFRQWLINEDFDFETGENYLRKQSESIKRSLVQQNPVLPYAFLLYDEDIERLKTLDVSCEIHQIVPILSYSDINNAFTVSGSTILFEDKLQLMCLYDNRMIDADNLDGYLAELENELDQTNNQLTHYQEQLEGTREDMQLLKQFTYDKNYLYDLEKQKESLMNKIEETKKQISALDAFIVENSEKKEKIIQRNTVIDDQLTKESERKIKLTEFMEEDKAYLQHQEEHKKLIEDIGKITKQKSSLNSKKTSLTEEKESLIKEQSELGTTIKDKQVRYKLYAEAEEAVQLDDEIESMEEKLRVLKSTITSQLEQLETDLAEKTNELEEKEALLHSYQLEEEDYINTIFNLENLNELNGKVRNLEEEEKKLNDNYQTVKSDLEVAKAKLELAYKEVKKLADEPLDQSLIKANFVNRRKGQKERILKAKDDSKKLKDTSNEYQTIIIKAEEQIDVNKHEVNLKYKISKSVDIDYNDLVSTLKNLRRENKKFEGNVSNLFNKIHIGYKGKNKHIENILIGLNPLLEGAQKDKNKYYFVGERLLLSKESLEKLIKACEQRLLNLEKNKKDMIQHSYLQAKQVYDEIQKIAENSSIKLDGKTRPIPMLKINMESIDETEEENSIKMKGYIESCVNIIKKDMHEEKKIEEIRKKISKYMSTRELLNVLSDLGKMTIYAYKIDINAQNSRYKSWEQVMKENSGGERFVSFFAVIVALMSYTRTSMKFEDDYERNQDTKVLIMDNPFGPISSEHLLRPLFKIANKYNTQLICLTDLKQNSILNCFNLIYMIKIRQNVFGTNEYIQLV